MKIIVTSDIHRKKQIIDHILTNYEADYYYDCGDSQLNNYELKDFYSVRGNCDYESYPDYRIVTINENNKIFLTHGHLYSMNELIKICELKNCNILIHGHTHKKRNEMINNIHVLNPGSISRPRAIGSNTFLIIDYDEQKDKISFEFVKLSL